MKSKTFVPNKLQLPLYFRKIEVLFVIGGGGLWLLSSNNLSTLLMTLIVPLMIILFLAYKRANFINKGLRYEFIENKINLYVSGKLYRTFEIENSFYSIENVFGLKSIVLKKGVGSFFSSDSVAGFTQDFGQNSYEFLIYNCSDCENIIRFLKESKKIKDIHSNGS